MNNENSIEYVIYAYKVNELVPEKENLYHIRVNIDYLVKIRNIEESIKHTLINNFKLEGYVCIVTIDKKVNFIIDLRD